LRPLDIMASILAKICQQRRRDIEEARNKLPLERLKALVLAEQESARGGPAFPLVNFPSRLLASYPSVAVLAEVKRASPSKGDIAPGIDAAKQGKLYADAGAAAISCLTEPTWFKGTLDDMLNIRQAIEEMGHDRRPALLRKDFILDEYQIYEARYYGADTVLLIVAALEEDELVRLMECSRSLGMEPLVETANAEEMQTALQVGAKVIGINNRDLHTFSVDLNTTSRLLSDVTQAANDLIFIALSGISTREDVIHFEKAGVSGILVGESLMRASSPANKVKELKGEKITFAKVCGIKDVRTAIAAAEAGADMIGLVFAESRRKLSIETAKEITDALAKWRKAQGQSSPFSDGKFPANEESMEGQCSFQTGAARLREAVSKRRPLVVGVFANNQAEMINEVAGAAPLDLIQLSGKEDPSIIHQLAKPCLKAIHVDGQPEEIVKSIGQFAGKNVLGVLLDTFDPNSLGGTGRTFDWSVAKEVQEKIALFVAGGLSPENVAAAVNIVEPLGVDVSSGVETEGTKDISKICAFIQQAKNGTINEETQVGDGSQFYLYGSPIGNSPSPLLHNTGFESLGLPYKYQLCDTKDIKQVAISLRDKKTGGGSVTIPHKQNIMPFLDVISADAKVVGAVNTVAKNEKGQLIGYNTDWLAIYQLTKQQLASFGQSTDHIPVGLVIGAGGTARAACYALSQLGAEFYIYNRTPGRAEHLAEHFPKVKGTLSTLEQLEQLAEKVDVIISTVPPTANFTLPASFLRKQAQEQGSCDLVIVELVYWPRFTPLLEQVRGWRQQEGKEEERGKVAVVEGIEILLAQGLAQFEIWTKKEAPKSSMTPKVLTTFKDGLYASAAPTSLRT